jgi:hypothetical protein
VRDHVSLKPRSEAELEQLHRVFPDGVFTHRISPQDAYPGIPQWLSGMPFTKLDG